MVYVRLGLACGLVGLLLAAARVADAAEPIETADLEKIKGAIVTLECSADARMPWEQSFAPADVGLLESWMRSEHALRLQRPSEPHTVTGFIIQSGNKLRILSLLNRFERSADSLRAVMEADAPTALKAVAWDQENNLVLLELSGERPDNQPSPDQRPPNQPSPNALLPALSLTDTPVAWGAPVRVLSQWKPQRPALSAGIVATESGFDRIFNAEVFEIDASVQPGSRGAPVLDGSGRVVGIVASPHGVPSGEGLVTVMGLEAVRRLVEFAGDGGVGAMPKAFMGVQLVPRGNRVFVSKTLEGSSAQKAGIRDGDQIVAVGSQPVRDHLDVTGAVRARRPGDQLELTIQREGETIQLTVTLDGSPIQANEALPQASEPDPGVSAPVVPLPRGLSGEQLRQQLERELDAPPVAAPALPPVVVPPPAAFDPDLRSKLEAINEQLRHLNEQVQQLQKKAPEK